MLIFYLVVDLDFLYAYDKMLHMKFLNKIFFVFFICCCVFSCKSTDPSSLLTPVMGETDTVLMSDMMPVALKAVEIVHYASPKNKSIHALTASLYVMYANAFVQHKADMMDISEFELQYSEKMRAKMHYLRGRDYSLSYFDRKYKNFSKNLLSRDPELEQKALSKLKKKDVAAAYWLGAACLGAFSLDPLDVDMLSGVGSALAVLERAAELDPSYNNGAIWDVLVAFYAGAPAEFGGNVDKAVESFLKEVEYSNGKTTSLYMTYAQVFCKNNIDLSSYEWDCSVSIDDLGWKFPEIPKDEFLESIGMGQNENSLWPMPTGVYGFDWALDVVLNMDVNEDPNSRFMTVLAQDKAKFLKEHREDYFIIW